MYEEFELGASYWQIDSGNKFPVSKMSLFSKKLCLVSFLRSIKQFAEYPV